MSIFDQASNLYQLEGVGITEDDPSTLEEEYEEQRILSLPEGLQQLAVDHKQDQFEAMPAYFNRFKQR